MAADIYDWFAAYQESGFTREEALVVISRGTWNIQNVMPATAMSPDVEEMYQRLNTLLTRAVADDER